MNLQTQLIIDKFLRRCCKNFTARDVSRLTAEFGGEFKISSKEAQEYLESSPLVFCLENGRYITRAGVFTGELFSIKPTAKEFDQRILIPGSRCIPFVDSEIVSSTLNFYDEDNKKLKKKTADYSIRFVLCWSPVLGPVQPVSPTRLRAKTAFPSGSSSSVPRGSPGMESCIRRRKHASCRPTGSSFP